MENNSNIAASPQYLYTNSFSCRLVRTGGRPINIGAGELHVTTGWAHTGHAGVTMPTAPVSRCQMPRQGLVGEAAVGTHRGTASLAVHAYGQFGTVE